MAARALITGTSGLIGSHLLEQWSVPGLEPVPHPRELDLLAPGAVQRVLAWVEASVVVHLAWCASGTPGYREHTDNARWVVATLELQAACAERRIPLVALGTVVDDTPGPDAYSRSKACLRAQMQSAVDRREVTWVRPHYVFDPDLGRPGVLAEARAAMHERRPARLDAPYGEHDFVHVRDVATGIMAIVRHQLGGAPDIGSGRLRPTHELVERAGAAWVHSGATVPSIRHDDRAADISTLSSVGWEPNATEEFFAS